MTDDWAEDFTTHLKVVDLSSLAESDIDPTRYAVEPILPKGHVTLLGSHGGAGKSILALAFAAHVVCGRPWNGLQVHQGNALYLSLEDPGELVRYRLRRISDEYGLDPEDVASGLTVLDGSMSDAVLATEVNDSGTRRLVTTPAMSELETLAEGMSLVVVDNASDAYDAGESDRRMVRAFVRHLAHIARQQDAAVLLLAHIDKAAARTSASGNTYSGSTAWHNSTRSRLALTEQDGITELTHEKNNLGKKIEPTRFEWTESGVLVPITDTGSAAVERNNQDDDAVLLAVEAAIKDGATVHAARTGSHSALATLKAYPDLPKELHKKDRFYAALTRLERVGRVSRERYKNEHRCWRERLIVRASLPHTPSELTHALGGGVASVVPMQNRRTTDALTQCKKCGGEGCEWCKDRL